MSDEMSDMSFYVEVPAEYPECHTCRTKHGVPPENDDEYKLDECAKFAADIIEHTWAKKISNDTEFAFAEIKIHANDCGIGCAYDPHGGPDGRGAIILGVE